MNSVNLSCVCGLSFRYQSCRFLHEIRLFPRRIVLRKKNRSSETDSRVFMVLERKCYSISMSRIHIHKCPDVLYVVTRAAESTRFQRLRLRLRLRLEKIDSDSNSDSNSDSDRHQSLFSHVEGQCFKIVISSLRNAFDAKYCLQARQQSSVKVCQDLVL